MGRGGEGRDRDILQKLTFIDMLSTVLKIGLPTSHAITSKGISHRLRKTRGKRSTLRADSGLVAKGGRQEITGYFGELYPGDPEEKKGKDNRGGGGGGGGDQVTNKRYLTGSVKRKERTRWEILTRPRPLGLVGLPAEQGESGNRNRGNIVIDLQGKTGSTHY